MAEYIDRYIAIRTAIEMCVKVVGHGITQFDAAEIANAFEDIPTADVVPKSEVEKVFEDIETCMKDFEDDDDGYILKKCEFKFFMREIKEKYAEQKNG